MDQKIFAQTFIQNRNKLLHFALWLAHDQDDAEDLVQEAYCYGWRRLGNIPDDPQHFMFWMLNGIRFLRCKTLRIESSEKRAYRHIENATKTACDEHMPDADAMLRPYKYIVFNAVRKLPKMYRTPLVLHAVYDYSYGEVSAIKHVLEGTLKSRMYRCKKTLRNNLAALAEEENFTLWKREPEPQEESSAGKNHTLPAEKMRLIK